MQEILALWTTKTAMTSNYLSVKEHVIQQSERKFLMDTKLPPQGWNIWIAPFKGIYWNELGIYQHVLALEVPTVNNGTPIPHYLMLTFMGMGHLFVLAISSSLGPSLAISGRPRAAGNWSNLAHQE